MKSLQTFLAENSALLNSQDIKKLVFNEFQFHVPILPNLVSAVSQKARIGIFWHYTDFDGLKAITEIQRKHNSISATEYAPWSYEGWAMFSNGVATHGGVVLKVVGRALTTHAIDVYSEIDSAGHRWVPVLFDFPKVIEHDIVRKLIPSIMVKHEIDFVTRFTSTAQTLNAWSKIPKNLPPQDVNAIIYDYIKGCEAICIAHRDKLQDIFSTTSHEHSLTEVILSNFRVLGGVMDRGYLCSERDSADVNALGFPVLVLNNINAGSFKSFFDRI